MDVVQGHVSSVWWSNKRMSVKWTLVELSNLILRALFYASCQQLTFWRVLYEVQAHRYSFSTSASEMLVLFLNTLSWAHQRLLLFSNKKKSELLLEPDSQPVLLFGVVLKLWSISEGTGLGSKQFTDILTNSHTNVSRSSGKRRKKGPVHFGWKHFWIWSQEIRFLSDFSQLFWSITLRQNKHPLSSSP